MKRTRFICIAAALALLLSACGVGSARGVLDEIAGALELDLSGCEVVSSWDDHGGFHGDGTAFAELNCSHTGVLNQIKEDGNWKAFPLDKTVQSLVYGVTEQTGPYLTGEEGDPLVPEIREGYYRLIDRHAKAGETDLLDRASLNFTLALYDTERDTLYFCEMDT